MRRILLPAIVLGLPACGSLPQNGLARAQQSAQEFNMDSRFGRTEMVLERVAPAAREQYGVQHRAWGNDVHIADVEIAGLKAKDEHEVKVFVHVSWYRADWELVAEKRVDGDVGLLGEAIVYAAPDTPKRPAQFPTIRLGKGEATGTD
jgi:hypothetical protein